MADRAPVVPLPPDSPDQQLMEPIRGVKKQTHQSWSNIGKAVRALQGKAHERFGTTSVAASSKSTVRRMLRETGLGPDELEVLLEEQGLWG